MQVKGLFTGKPREVEYNGKIISTGIFKYPIVGPVKVYTLNMEGDGQADLSVHGGINKAVYAYPIEHYTYWQDTRPDLSFEVGTFGENLSVSGMKEDSVFIGDTYQIGEVTFSVTTPRMPCFKLGLRVGDPSFIKDFLKANKSGFYFKVLQEGRLDIGDHIKKVGEDGYRLSIREVVSLYDKQKTNKALLTKAVNSPSLPQDWIDHFRQKLKALI